MDVPDLPRLKVAETLTLRKFAAGWTEEQVASGEAEPYEIVEIEDGVVRHVWRQGRGQER